MYRMSVNIYLCFREDNRRSHTKPGSVPFVPERQKNVVGEQE